MGPCHSPPDRAAFRNPLWYLFMPFLSHVLSSTVMISHSTWASTDWQSNLVRQDIHMSRSCHKVAPAEHTYRQNDV